ncbi:MAG: hypothetical protein JG768_1418, partial [Fusobacteriales bacterium]|nr:hypothetical protein [Fusobacteriales bacterium]
MDYTRNRIFDLDFVSILIFTGYLFFLVCIWFQLKIITFIKVSILIFTGYLFFHSWDKIREYNNLQSLNPYFYWISILSFYSFFTYFFCEKNVSILIFTGYLFFQNVKLNGRITTGMRSQSLFLLDIYSF